VVAVITKQAIIRSRVVVLGLRMFHVELKDVILTGLLMFHNRNLIGPSSAAPAAAQMIGARKLGFGQLRRSTM
jgi:hypothetical protein